MTIFFRSWRRIIAESMRYRAVLKNRIQPIVDLNAQTRILPDGSRVCSYMKSNEMRKTHYSDVKTLYDTIRRGAQTSNNGEMLGARNKKFTGKPYSWIHYNEVIDRSVNIAHAFRKFGLPIGQHTCIGIYSKNCPEWIIVEHATYTFNNILVPLYETLEPDACVFIINETEIRLVVCGNLEKAKELLKHRSVFSHLEVLVVIEESIPQDDVENAESLGIKLITMAELERIGREEPRIAHQPPTPNDLATICYTSGTTGNPKGGMLTHGNIIADCTTLDYFKSIYLSSNDVAISYLPLSHMFERVVQSVIYIEGGRVGFFSGQIKTLADDIKTLRPTVIPVVPRVLNRIYDTVMEEVNKSAIKKALFEVAMGYKMFELQSGIVRTTSWADRLVLKKIRDGMGGRVKLMITGSAPIDGNVLSFTRAAMGCTVVEGYGQTEAVACVSISLEGDLTTGHVGVPIPCNSVKLIDVPEMNYFAKDNVGEICVKGENVFRGYFKNDEETQNVLDKDGWLHTNDIGKWTEQGTLQVFDRKNNIFKLSQGEYVSSEKIENVYARSKYVRQSFVYGDSLKHSLVAIIVPDYEVLHSAVLKKFGLKNVSLEELCKREDVKQLIMMDLAEVGQNAKLAGFERAKEIQLSSELFSVENGLLTPTLKSRRSQLKQRYGEQIDLMYAKLE